MDPHRDDLSTELLHRFDRIVDLPALRRTESQDDRRRFP